MMVDWPQIFRSAVHEGAERLEVICAAFLAHINGRIGGDNPNTRYAEVNEKLQSAKPISYQDRVILFRGMSIAEARTVQNGKYENIGPWWTHVFEKARYYAEIADGVVCRIVTKGDYIKVQIEIHSESLVDVYGALSHAEEITFIPITVKKSG